VYDEKRVIDRISWIVRSKSSFDSLFTFFRSSKRYRNYVFWLKKNNVNLISTILLKLLYFYVHLYLHLCMIFKKHLYYVFLSRFCNSINFFNFNQFKFAQTIPAFETILYPFNLFPCLLLMKKAKTWSKRCDF